MLEEWITYLGAMSNCTALLKIPYGIAFRGNDFAGDSHTEKGGEKQETRLASDNFQLLRNVAFSFTRLSKDAETLPTWCPAGHQGNPVLRHFICEDLSLHQQEEDEDKNRTGRGKS